jgi:Phospholipase_D-nuclease N-terminal
MKGLAFFFLFFCLAINCIAAEKVYTDADLKSQPPIYSKSPLAAVPPPYRQSRESRGFHEQSQSIFQHNFKTNSYSDLNKKPVQAANLVNTYPPSLQAANRMIAESFARATIFMLLVAGIPFLIGLICLIDILRNEFTGNNKIIWFLLVLFLPVLGAILYFFIGTDQKIRPEDDEEPVVRLI